MIDLPVGEIETLSRVLSFVAGLAGLGWAFLCVNLNVSRKAAFCFSAANFLLILGDVFAQFRGSGVSFIDYYQTFNFSYLCILCSVFLFSAGTQELQGVDCHARRNLALTILVFAGAMGIGAAIGMRSPAVDSLFLVAGGLSLLTFLRSYHHLIKTLSRKMAVALLWPFAAMGVLFLLRVVNGVMTIGQPLDYVTDTMQIKNMILGLWGQLLVFLLINASLIGQTLNGLFKRLQDQASRLQRILDTAPVGVAVSSGGLIRFANPRVTELLDMKVGDSASNALVWPEARAKIVAELKAKGSVSNMEIQMHCPHRTVRDFLVTYLPTVYEGESAILGWMVDITDRKRDEQKIRQASDEQSAIFESTTLGIVFIKDRVIVRCNHMVDTLFGSAPGTQIGQTTRSWYPNGNSLISDAEAFIDLAGGEIHRRTQELQRRDGSLFWCRLSGSALNSENLALGTVWTLEDVTEARRAAELVREARDIAEDATRMKSDFLANMSHEIRTPMNAIIGMSHLALKTDLSAKQRNYIEKVDSAARNLLGIINDILDFSKIEAGKMRFEAAEFHLEDVMENLADLSVIKAQDKGLELLFDVGPDVPTALVGDSLRLGQVLINLVGNAIKFTDRGEVTVGVHTVDFDLGKAPTEICLRFSVTDTGVGLTEEQRNKLFSAFSQADASTTRKYGGTGLGLSISKRLVELMQGDIGVQSQLGAGSVFFFTAKFGLQGEQRVRTQLDDDVTGLRILVVDDNARAREIVLAILSSQKFDAKAVQSGEEAIMALEEAQQSGRPYGLVLMDWMMPGLDGLASIQRIRSDPKLTATPAFVMVTAHSRDEFMEQAGATRIDGLLLKPVGPSALLDSILSALGKEVASRGRKQQRQEASYEAQQSLRGAHLLLVEDNLINQELALEILQDAGIQVEVASNGAEAVGKVTRGHFDGVLMDCQMPVMDGFEATRQIRADGRFGELPILAMTANAMSGDRELCLEAGMNDHIGKPIDVNQLFFTMARWIKPKNPQAVPSDPAKPERFGRDADLPAIANLDLNQAMRRMGGNVKLMRKLIGRFAETQTDAIDRIQIAVAGGHMETATREAHTVKGLAGNIGASQLLALAGVVEGCLKHGQMEALPKALDAMAAELSVLLAQIAAAMGPVEVIGLTATTGEMVDRTELAKELQQLAALLADDDARAAKVVESIAEKLRNLGQGSVSAQLQKLIGKYEFEEALAMLQETAKALDVSLEILG